MPIQDNPVRSERNIVQDNPIVNRRTQEHSDQTEKFMATQASFLDSYVTGNSVLDNYNYYSGVINKAKELQRLANDKAEADSEELTEEFIANPYGSSGSIEEQAAAVRAATLSAIEQSRNVDLQATEAMMGDSTNFDMVEPEAARASMFKILSDAQAGISKGDEYLDFGKALLPFVSTYEGYRLTGDIFGQDEEIKKAIAAFQVLPVEEQAAIFPQLRDELVDKMGEVGGVETLANFLAPLGAENPQRYGDVDTLFDAIDAAGVGLALGATFYGIRKGFNVARTMDNLGNEQGAADVSTAAMLDPEVARASGMTQETALGNGLPYDTSMEDLGHVSGLSGPILDNTRTFFNDADQTAQDIMSGNGFLREGVVNTRQRAELEQDVISRLKAEQAENIKQVGREGNTTRFTYNVRDEDGNITEETYDLELTLNDAGYWDQSEGSLLAEWFGSNTVYAKNFLREDVDTVQRIDYLSSRINNQLHKLTREALRPIGLFPTPSNRAALARVDKALREGDEWKNPTTGQRGKVFGSDELRTHYGLDDNEVSAYFRLNRLYNNIFHIQNFEKRQEHLLRQYKYINLARSDEGVEGKVFANTNDASLSLRQSNINYVYDADADELVDVRTNTNQTLDNLYNEDKVLTRVESPYDIGGGRGHVYYIATSRTNIEELPQQVLHWKPGYVPRIYEDAAYFVKEFFDTTVDGDKTYKAKRTLRFFDNRKDADTYINTLVARAVEGVAEGSARRQAEKVARDKYKVLSDREEEILSAATGEIGHGTGGLYTGARAQDDILFGLEGTKPRRLNSFESLTRNVGRLSRFVSLNQWRLGMEQRWINTANKILSAKGSDRRVTSFERLPTISEAVGEVRFLNHMYDQIRDWQHFPSVEERAWAASTQKVFDWAANRGYRRTAKLLGWLGSKDPIAVARATAFHSLLGWFNPAQFWVQAQGMMNAFALGLGKYAGRAQGNMLAFTAMDTAGDKANLISKLAAKAVGTSEEELMDMYRLWNKTGYKDSVLQTADHAAASKGYGMTSELFRRLADGGLIAYRNGELLNRRLSFLTAVERWKEANPGKAVRAIDDDALKSIMSDANNMMLGMTKANRAAWQKGILSLPTQFFQVTAKFMETMLGFNNSFTRAERGRMFLAQILFYGTAGIPAVNYVNNIITESFGITQQDIDNNPAAVKAWNDGIWGWSTLVFFGADIELSSRGSLLRSVSDQIDNWFVQESTITEKLFGAFGSTGMRFWDSFTYNLKPFTMGEVGNVDWEDAASLAFSPFMDTLSTSRNIKKAMYMNRLNAIYSRHGRPVDTRDYSLSEEIAQGIGFQTTVESETWDLQQMNKATEELKQDITSYVIRRMNEFAFKHPDGGYTEEEWLEYRRDVGAATAVLDPDEMLELTRAIDQSIKSGSRRSREIQIALRNLKETTTDELLNLRSTLTGSKILRVGEEEEE